MVQDELRLAPASLSIMEERWGDHFINSGEIIILFLLVIGGLYGGSFTPNEAAAVGAFGALPLIKRKITWKIFTKSLNETGNNRV